MDIATITLAHDKIEVVADTLDSLHSYMSNKNLVVVDEAGWERCDWQSLKAVVEKGYYHNFRQGPYRNSALGIWRAAQLWPDVKWYCYFEYDALVLNEGYKKELAQAEKDGCLIVGNEYTTDEFDLPLLEKILTESVTKVYHLGGFCQFMHRDMVQGLMKRGFFERFLEATKGFENGYFPREKGKMPAFEEELWATLAGYLGGGPASIRELAGWDGMFVWDGGASEPRYNVSHGDWRKFPMRFRPEIGADEVFPETSLVHPVKDFDHPVRASARAARRAAGGVASRGP